MSIYLATFGKLRYLGLAEIAEPFSAKDRWIVIKTLRGLEMGLLGGTLSQEQEAKYRAASLEDSRDEQTRGPEPMLQEVEFVEVANASQIEEYYKTRSEEDSVLIRSRELLSSHQLDMKLVDVEYMMDRRKLFFYFTSEQRIDFRNYVRDLAREFRARIEMRQIGVRDEARAVRGISPCGRPCCCSYWLHSFKPICIRMVKEQNLALNPTKISGICGRLMCCMAYEYPVYSELWKGLPSPGAKIKTEQGTYVVDGVDLKTESVRVRFPSGREILVAIKEFADFKDAVLSGANWETDNVDEIRKQSYTQRKKSSSAEPKKASDSEKTDALHSGSARILKAEKISLEEHLAGLNSSVTDVRESTKPSTRSAPNEPKTEGGKRRPDKKQGVRSEVREPIAEKAEHSGKRYKKAPSIKGNVQSSDAPDRPERMPRPEKTANQPRRDRRQERIKPDVLRDGELSKEVISEPNQSRQERYSQGSSEIKVFDGVKGRKKHDGRRRPRDGFNKKEGSAE